MTTTIVPGSLRFLQEFEDDAFGKVNTRVNIRLYSGELMSEPVAANEVAEVRYFDSTIEEKHLTPVSKKIFAWLKAQDFID